MPRNPLDHPLFQPTAIRIAGLLALALVLILVVERGRFDRRSVLVQRIGSWAVMAPLFTLSVFARGVVSFGLVVFMTIQALREYSRLVKLQRAYANALMAYGLFALVITAAFANRFFLFLPLGAFALASLVPLFRLSRIGGEPKAEILQGAATVLGYMWIPLFLSFFVLIGRVEADAVAILLLFGFAVALSDVLAFTLGKVAGGPRLAKAVSPNKTWAGAAGNVAGAYAAFALMSFAIPTDWSGMTRAILPAVIAIGALWGDLVESLVKRSFGVKDAGDVIPGFGGLLDRIDSLLVAMPLGYYGLVALQHFS